MSERASLESIAPNADEAIQKGLAELGLSLDEVEIEILDEGQPASFGIEERQARVRLTVKEGLEASPAPEEEEEPEEAAAATETSSPAPRIELSDDDLENTMSIARATVQELLEHMGIYHAEVQTSLGEIADGDGRDAPILLDISGSDLSILIGRNAETLNALQLITRMIVGKEIGQSAHLIVDVEGYRGRREDNLRQLARTMAEQALSTGRRQSLEPMPPAERRIVHIELRDNEAVRTESSGEEPKRKVVVIPV